MRTWPGWAWLTRWWRQRGQAAATALPSASASALAPAPAPATLMAGHGPVTPTTGTAAGLHHPQPDAGPVEPPDAHEAAPCSARPDQIALQAIAQARGGARAPPAADQWEPF